MSLPSTVMPPPPRGKEGALLAVSEGWARLAACFAGLSPEQMEAPGAAGDWPSRDVVAHAEGWFRACLQSLRALLEGAGKPPDFTDVDAWNERFVVEARDLKPGELVRRVETSFRELKAYLKAMPADRFEQEEEASWVEGCTWGHFAEHYCELWRLRGERGWLPAPPTLEGMPAEKDTGLKTLWIEYDKLYGSLLGLSAEDLVAAGVAGGWSVRDILAHIAAWQRAVVDEIPRVLAGQATSADLEVVDDFNARAVERAQQLPVESIVKEYHSANNHFFAYARTLIDAAFRPGNPAREWLLPPHPAEHYPQIWAWRRQRGSRPPTVPTAPSVL